MPRWDSHRLLSGRPSKTVLVDPCTKAPRQVALRQSVMSSLLVLLVRHLSVQTPKHRVVIEALNVGIFEAFAGADGGDEGAAIRVFVDGPDERVGAAAEAVFIFGGENFGVVVGADVFEGGGLAAF